jgi:hypothetical protein
VCPHELAMMDSPRTANKQVILNELLMCLWNMEKNKEPGDARLLYERATVTN